MAKNLRKVKHLLLRAGFGESYAQLQKYSGQSLRKVTDTLFDDSSKIQPLNMAEKPVLRAKGEVRTQKERNAIRDANNKILEDMLETWRDRMALSPAMLREKMALFWHGHFACRPRGPYLTQLQYNIFHTHALGSFRDMLHAVSKDPAMVLFLNNAQNRKGSPNENFAREVMELFTMGRGNYTEKDIQEVARAFTGWSANREGDFIFRKGQHDFEEKTIFGKTGKFEGEDVLDMLLDNRQTSRFLAGKIYREFVNDKEDPEIVAALAKSFYESNYDIGQLMRTIFTSDWFFAEKNMGTRIKSPLEYIVGMMRTTHLSFTNPKSFKVLQRLLGQELFRPPNVAGWPGGRNWIDSTTLLIRLKLPDYMFSDVDFPYSNKNEGDAQEMQPEYRTVRRIQAEADWNNLNRQFRKVPDKDLAEAVCDLLIQPEIDPQRVQQRLLGDSRKDRLKSYIINAMALPEYQLC